MNWIQEIDATIIVAVVGLIGTIFTMYYKHKQKQKDSMVQANEQLIEVVKTLSEEIINLKSQHAEESRKLEAQIIDLKTENRDLRKEISKLNNHLIKLGIQL